MGNRHNRPQFHQFPQDQDSPINSQSATFSFTSNEDDSTFECKMDSGSWSNCTSSTSFSNLAEGSHIVSKLGLQMKLAIQESPDYHNWTIDITNPITTINSNPANQTNSQNATFTFSSNEQDSSFECKLDEGGWSDCNSPKYYYNLSEGTHYFEVRATDEAGNIGEEATYNWSIDVSGSSAYISSGPNNPTNSDNATFYFGSYESTDTLQCNLDSAGWSDCTSPKTYYDLSEGNHNFSLRAIDLVGNIGTIAYYNWTTDYTNPVVTITSSPPSLTNSSSATFTFSSNEYNSTFECKLEHNSSWSSCSTPITYNGLSESTHNFYVRTTDEAGNLGNTLTYSWLTDYTAPVVTFTDYPSVRTNENLTTFNFTADETASFECSFDYGEWYDCNHPVSFSNLAEGTYLFKVRATDNANNTGNSTDYG